MRHGSQIMLMMGPERKARIKSFIEPALKGQPRRWAYVVPGPRSGAVRGVANSWREARDAVVRHIKAMYHDDGRGGRHRSERSPSSSRGRHASFGVRIPPPRDHAMSFLSNFLDELRGLGRHAAVG